MKRLILAEPGLARDSRHEPAHARMLAAECGQRGLACNVLAATNAGADFLDTVPARETFHINVYARPRSARPAAALFAWRSWSRRYRRDFTDALDDLRCEVGDLVLLNTVKIAVLDGFAGWLAGRPPHARPLVAVILRLDADNGLPGNALPGASRWLYRRVLDKLHRLLGRRLLLATDTRLIGEDFERLTGRPVADIPLPIEVPTAVPPRPGLASVHLVFPSSARGRGFQLLPGALAAALARHQGLAATVRVPDQQRKRNATFIARLRDMAPRVRLLEGMLDEDQFHALLSDADAVLLPYDPDVFAKRSSQILAQSAALGRPVIVIAGSFLDRECRSTGIIGVTAAAFTAEALAAAIDRFIAEREHLAATAWAACPAQRQRHTAAAFVDRLAEFAAACEVPASATPAADRPERRSA